MTFPCFGSKIMNFLVFFNLESKKGFRVPTPWNLYETDWNESLCNLCTFHPSCYVGGFGNLLHILCGV